MTLNNCFLVNILILLTFSACSQSNNSSMSPDSPKVSDSMGETVPERIKAKQRSQKVSLNFDYNSVEDFYQQWTSYDVSEIESNVSVSREGIFVRGYSWIVNPTSQFDIEADGIYSVALTYMPDPAGSEIIMGLEGFDVSGTRAVNQFGEAVRSNQYTISSRKKPAIANADGSVTLLGHFGESADSATNLTFHENVRSVRPVIITNYKEADRAITLMGLEIYREAY